MNEDKHTIKQGHLDVGDGHKIYFQQWGNKTAQPIFFLHGGPGSQTKDKHKSGFDPKKHHVIFHDQRGCGQSTPFGELKNNTTQDLIEDINKLKAHLKIEGNITLFGGSWGSALALAYAVEYPDKVHRMLLNGIYTGTRAENDYIQQGGLATHFPESYEEYANLVPKDQKDETTKFYFAKMQDGDQEEADIYIKSFVRNELAAMSIDPDYSLTKLQTEELTDEDRKSALLEPHYFTNDCFLPDNHILNNADKLSSIPIVFVQGRFDHVCPPITAYNLAKAIGENCHLHIVPANHASENSLREVIRAYIWSFLD